MITIKDRICKRRSLSTATAGVSPARRPAFATLTGSPP